MTAATAARLLTMFAELPSTPPEIAERAACEARQLSLGIPFPSHSVTPGTHRHGVAPTSVPLERGAVTSSAGLLGLLAAMPSTPPDLRAEAEEAAETLWDALDAS